MKIDPFDVSPRPHRVTNDSSIVVRCSAPIPQVRSARARRVAELFGLKIEPADAMPVIRLQAREIVLIVGPSGAGKSSLLRHALGAQLDIKWIDLNRIRLPKAKTIIECFPGADDAQTMDVLSRVGLAEVWTYLRLPGELSEGQRWRLRLALAMWGAARGKGPAVILADEFCATLDRITAAVVARALRRAIDAAENLSALVATSHDDILDALEPNRVVRCDFGKIETKQWVELPAAAPLVPERACHPEVSEQEADRLRAEIERLRAEPTSPTSEQSP